MAQAVTVYKREYWDKVKADQLPAGVDYAVADFAVNSGPARAAKYLQAVVGVAQDGLIGAQTIDAVNRAPASVVITLLCDRRVEFLRRLPTWADFGKGWSARVASVRAAALADIGAVDEGFVRPDVEPVEPRTGFMAWLIETLMGLFGKR